MTEKEKVIEVCDSFEHARQDAVRIGKLRGLDAEAQFLHALEWIQEAHSSEESLRRLQCFVLWNIDTALTVVANGIRDGALKPRAPSN